MSESKLEIAKTQFKAELLDLAAACRAMAPKLMEEDSTLVLNLAERVEEHTKSAPYGPCRVNHEDFTRWEASLASWKSDMSRLKVDPKQRISMKAVEETLAKLETPIAELLTPKEMCMRRASLIMLAVGCILGAVVLSEISALISGLGFVGVYFLRLVIMKIYLFCACAWVAFTITMFVVLSHSTLVCDVTQNWSLCDEVQLYFKIVDCVTGGITFIGIVFVSWLCVHFALAGHPRLRDNNNPSFNTDSESEASWIGRTCKDA